MTRSPLSIFLALGLIPYSLSHAETVIRVTPEQSLTDAVKQAQTAAKPVKIELAAGRYELSAPLVLTGAHSGLTFSAAGDARPVIAGSVRVKNWKLADVARGLWQADVPDAKDGKWQPR